MKQFSLSYVDKFLFRKVQQLAWKKKLPKDGNKEGKVDQVGALPFDRDTWKSGPVSVYMTSLCNTEGFPKEEALCLPPALLSNGLQWSNS